MVNVRLKQFLYDNKVYDPRQSGFRSGFSTLDAISRLENEIRLNQINRKITVTIFIDISQAFDSINHQALFHKIKNIGINGNLACFIQNFLTDRS